MSYIYTYTVYNIHTNHIYNIHIHKTRINDSFHAFLHYTSQFINQLSWVYVYPPPIHLCTGMGPEPPNHNGMDGRQSSAPGYTPYLPKGPTWTPHILHTRHSDYQIVYILFSDPKKKIVTRLNRTKKCG